MLSSASTQGEEEEEEACTEKAFGRLPFHRELDWSQGDKLSWIKSDVWATFWALPNVLTGAEPKSGINSDDPPYQRVMSEFFTSLQNNRTSANTVHSNFQELMEQPSSNQS